MWSNLIFTLLQGHKMNKLSDEVLSTIISLNYLVRSNNFAVITQCSLVGSHYKY